MVGAKVMEYVEKAELLYAFFAAVFTAKPGLQASQSLEVKEEASRKEVLCLFEADQVRNHLSKVGTR